jgi:hypothetical protein
MSCHTKSEDHLTGDDVHGWHEPETWVLLGVVSRSDEIVFELRQLGEPARITALGPGVCSPAFAVALPALRSMAKRIGRDHRLASELWGTAVREPRILASPIDEPERVTRPQMDQRAHVRKGASWALRQIGKRNDHLRTRVLAAVGPCIDSDSRDPRWVARDVSRELSPTAALSGKGQFGRHAQPLDSLADVLLELPKQAP